MDNGPSGNSPKSRGILKGRGVFITLEGIDGTGKSTQLRLLHRYLRKQGFDPLLTREPGGTKVGEQIRRILLATNSTKLAPVAELALMYAARAQHIEEIIRPALEQGKVVLSDRFNDASFAYQGYGHKLGTEMVQALDQIVCGDTQPDLTLLLDLNPKAALARAGWREAQRNSRFARFEAKGLAFHQRVRAGYLAIARRAKNRVKIIEAAQPAETIQAEIRSLVDALLDWHFASRGHPRRDWSTKRNRKMGPH